jgi:hypothetical protein
MINRKIYPLDAIEEIINDGYNPFIIANTHENSYLNQEKAALLEIKKRTNSRNLTIACEILPPIQLQYIKDFLVDEQEYENHGTIKGSKPEEWRIESLRSYREKLARNHAEELAIWLLDHKFNAVPLEHDDALDWSKEIDMDMDLHERVAEEFGWSEVGKIIRFYKDIERDIHNLHMINKNRPDLISVGCAHAIIYDYLLGRDGGNSIYIPKWTQNLLPIDAESIKAAQKVYSERH